MHSFIPEVPNSCDELNVYFEFPFSHRSAKGFMHMRIQQNENGKFILGEFSQPFDSVPDIIKHFCMNRLPVRGAEHMCLIEPVIAQLL